MCSLFSELLNNDKVDYSSAEKVLSENPNLKHIVEAKKEKIYSGELTHQFSPQVQNDLLLASILSPLGRYVLQNPNLNGVWRSHIASDKYLQSHASLAEGKEGMAFEKFFFHHCPQVIAYQQFYATLKMLLTRLLKKPMRVLSFPSGLLGEILELDVPLKKGTEIVAIDPDEETVSALQEIVKERGLEEIVKVFQQESVSSLQAETFDVVVAPYAIIGEKEIKEVYGRVFESFRLLKPKGTMLTGFCTPPGLSATSEWVQEHISKKDLELQDFIVFQLMGIPPPLRMRTEQCINLLQAVGFVHIDIYPDLSNIHPGIMAQK